MDKAALHPSTHESLRQFISDPSHALCLVGPPGAGKAYIADLLATELLGSHADDAIYNVGGQGNISIDEVRKLQQFLRLKKPGMATIRRVVIIDQAQAMSDEAQNALLKTLEEPPADTVFILTTDGSANLRPTIYSRTQRIQVLPLSLEQSRSHFTAKDADLSRAYHLSGGHAGLMHALLNDTEHQLVTAVEQAKAIMQASPYQRLLMVDGFAKQKDTLPTLFYALQRVMGAILPRTTDEAKLKRLTAGMRAVYEAELDAGKNANPKLLLSDLFLML